MVARGNKTVKWCIRGLDGYYCMTICGNNKIKGGLLDFMSKLQPSAIKSQIWEADLLAYKKYWGAPIGLLPLFF